MAILIRQRTAEEMEKLKTLIGAGASAMRCSAALKRNEGSVKKQAKTLGLSVAGGREVAAKARARIAEAEKSLPRGDRKFDGSFVK